MEGKGIHICLLFAVLSLVGNAIAKDSWKGAGNSIVVDPDKGHFDNCGDPSHNFTLTWSPKELNFDQKHFAQFSVDFIPAEDWSAGKVCATVNLDPYTEPIYEGCTDGRCEQVEKYIPGLCPFKKGKEVKLGRTVPLQTPIPIPPSVYKIKIEVKTASGSSFLCLQGALTVVDPDY